MSHPTTVVRSSINQAPIRQSFESGSRVNLFLHSTGSNPTSPYTGSFGPMNTADAAFYAPESPTTALSEPRFGQLPPSPAPPYSPSAPYNVPESNPVRPHTQHIDSVTPLLVEETQYSPEMKPSEPDNIDPALVCLFCKKKNTDGTQDFCRDDCVKHASHNAPHLLPVPEEHHAFRKVHNIFQKGWPKKYRVRSVYRIVCTSELWKGFNGYRTELDNHPLRPGANLQMHWATARPCEILHSTSIDRFCRRADCGLCEIMRPSTTSTLSTLISQADPQYNFMTLAGRRYVNVLCVAALGHTYEHGRGQDPLQCNSTVKRKWFSDRITITLPKQGVLPAYLVYFE